jgi:hypothetical protein
MGRRLLLEGFAFCGMNDSFRPHRDRQFSALSVSGSILRSLRLDFVAWAVLIDLL